MSTFLLLLAVIAFGVAIPWAIRRDRMERRMDALWASALINYSPRRPRRTCSCQPCEAALEEYEARK